MKPRITERITEKYLYLRHVYYYMSRLKAIKQRRIHIKRGDKSVPSFSVNSLNLLNLLFNLRSLADSVTKIVEFASANLTLTKNFNLCNIR